MEHTFDPKQRCWAFHRDGERCELIAGHDDDHAVSKSWTDLECATPGEFPAPAPAAPAADPIPVPQICICDHNKVAHSSGVGACGICDCRGYVA